MTVRIIGSNVTGSVECGFGTNVIIRLDRGWADTLMQDRATIPALEVEYIQGSEEDPATEAAEVETIAAARQRQSA